MLRDSPQLNVFCAISRRKVFGEPTVAGSAYHDALQLGLFPPLEENELHLAARWCTASLTSLSTRLVEHDCPNQWIGLKGPPNTTFTRSDAI
ncbi:hypothetical protein TNCV_3449121 [Trichonephila clavipes]|nr:hypothetical protein TNCV_3449121 [Trichonephila clavipes]